MAQIAANPWLFLPADQATSVGVSSITNNTSSILVTTSAAHGIVNNQTAVSLQGTTYNGPYRVLAIPSTTTLLLQNRDQNRGNANGGAAGNLLTMAYIGGHVRAEQILWNQPGTAAATVLLTDGYGNVIWNPSVLTTNTAGTSYTYGKVYWVQNGLVINTLTVGSVQITVN